MVNAIAEYREQPLTSSLSKTTETTIDDKLLALKKHSHLTCHDSYYVHT